MKFSFSGIKNQIVKRKELIVIVIFSLALGYLLWKYYTKGQEVPVVEMTQKALDPPKIPMAQLKTLEEMVNNQKAPIELTRYRFLLEHNLLDPEYAKSYYEYSIQIIDYLEVAKTKILQNNISSAISEIRKITDDERFILLRPRATDIIDLLKKNVFDNTGRKTLLTKENCQNILQVTAGIRRSVGGFGKLGKFEKEVNAHIESLN
jgi:hypothetical protein